MATRYKDSEPKSATFYFEQSSEFDAWELRWLLDYWQGLCGDRDCPRLIDVGLPEIVRQAPKIIVRDAVDGGRDFVNRFWGSEMRAWLGFDGTGRKLTDYYPAAALKPMLDAHRLALTGDLPVRRWGITAYPKANMATFEAIDLPLADDMNRRAHVLSMYVYRTDDQGAQADIDMLHASSDNNAESWSLRSRHNAES